MVLSIIFRVLLCASAGFYSIITLPQNQPYQAVTEVYDDNFVSSSHLELKPFLAKYKPILVSQKKQPNAYVPKQIDYIQTYELKANRFTFYKTPSKILILAFTLTSSEMKLAKNVAVGMSQEAFERVFKKKLSGNIATVAETEQFELYTFKFSNHALVSIDYQCRIE